MDRITRTKFEHEIPRILAHLFVKIPWPGDSNGSFSDFSQGATWYFLSNHSKVEASHNATVFAQGNNKRNCQIFLHTIALALNIKHKKVVNINIQSLLVWRERNRTQVYELLGGRSN